MPPAWREPTVCDGAVITSIASEKFTGAGGVANLTLQRFGDLIKSNRNR